VIVRANQMSRSSSRCGSSGSGRATVRISLVSDDLLLSNKNSTAIKNVAEESVLSAALLFNSSVEFSF
jgi:hypothetical protein